MRTMNDVMIIQIQMRLICQHTHSSLIRIIQAGFLTVYTCPSGEGDLTRQCNERASSKSRGGGVNRRVLAPQTCVK